MDKLIETYKHSNRILIISDNETYYVADYLLNSINYNKFVFNYFIRNYDRNFIENFTILNDNYIIMKEYSLDFFNTNDELNLFDNQIRYESDLVILLKRNKLSVIKDRNNNLTDYKKYDVFSYNRISKINNILKRIENGKTI